MKVTLEELAQPYLIRIIEEDKETIAQKLQKVWDTKKDSIMLDGFRKGKVPQGIAEKTQGFQNLYREYLDEVISTAVERINAENNVTVVDLQQVVPEKLDKNGIVMQAVAYLKPAVVELDYSNVKVEKRSTETTEEEVMSQITQLQNQNALLAPVSDRGVQFGDIIVVSYVGSVDGTPFQGGTATRQQFVLLESSFIPGFGQAILDMRTDETKTFEVTFPEDYHATALAGKQASFDLTIHEIKVKNLPDLDDDFAITCGYANYEAMKEETKTSINSRKAEHVKSQTETDICLELIRRAKISALPQTMVQKRLTNLLQQELNTYGLSEQDYFKQRKINRETFDSAYYSIATRDLKIQLVLDYVANKEGLVVSDSEREQYVSEESARLGYTTEQVYKMITVDQIDSQVKLRKAYDYLLANVTYTEPTNESTNG
jgi:trigger factor